MPSSVLIRRARHDEGAAIADLQTRSWHETYAKDLPAEDLAQVQFDARTWADRITAAGRVGATTAIYVAEVDDRMVGFAACGPDLDAAENSGTGQLYSIYVLREAQGTGVGRRLHLQVLDTLRSLGFTDATLWVLASNAAAIRFYEIADWRSDDARRIDERNGMRLDEVRYRRTLGRDSDDY